jgi:hypothetical protein
MLRSHTYISYRIWRWCIGAGTRFLVLILWNYVMAEASRDLGFVSSFSPAAARESSVQCNLKLRITSLLTRKDGSMNHEFRALRPFRIGTHKRSKICWAMDAETTRDPRKEIVVETKPITGNAGGEYAIERSPTIINQVDPSVNGYFGGKADLHRSDTSVGKSYSPGSDQEDSILQSWG